MAKEIKPRRRPLYPIRPKHYTDAQAASIGRWVLRYLDGIGKHDEINGGDFVADVLEGIDQVRKGDA